MKVAHSLSHAHGRCSHGRIASARPCPSFEKYHTPYCYAYARHFCHLRRLALSAAKVAPHPPPPGTAPPAAPSPRCSHCPLPAAHPPHPPHPPPPRSPCCWPPWASGFPAPAALRSALAARASHWPATSWTCCARSGAPGRPATHTRPASHASPLLPMLDWHMPHRSRHGMCQAVLCKPGPPAGPPAPPEQ